jgi:hypothetical protein
MKKITIRETISNAIFASYPCPDSMGASHGCPRCLTEQIYAALALLAAMDFEDSTDERE